MTPMDRDSLPSTCQWHADEIAKIKEETSGGTRKIALLESDVRLLLDRIPQGIAISLREVQMKVDQALVGIASLDRKVSEGYVARGEFETLRTEHDLVKRLVFGTVALILTAVITALVYLVVKR
jgi:hypothetical protein